MTTHAQLTARRKALAKRRNVHEAKLARSAGVITLVCHDEGLWWVECDTQDRGIHIMYTDILDTKEVDVWDISIAHSTSTLSTSELNDLLLETALSNFN